MFCLAPSSLACMRHPIRPFFILKTILTVKKQPEGRGWRWGHELCLSESPLLSSTPDEFLITSLSTSKIVHRYLPRPQRQMGKDRKITDESKPTRGQKRSTSSMSKTQGKPRPVKMIVAEESCRTLYGFLTQHSLFIVPIRYKRPRVGISFSRKRYWQLRRKRSKQNVYLRWQ